MLPTSAGVEPTTSWSPVGRRIQLSHRGQRSRGSKMDEFKYYEKQGKEIDVPIFKANTVMPFVSFVGHNLKRIKLISIIQIWTKDIHYTYSKTSIHQSPQAQVIRFDLSQLYICQIWFIKALNQSSLSDFNKSMSTGPSYQIWFIKALNYSRLSDFQYIIIQTHQIGFIKALTV